MHAFQQPTDTQVQVLDQFRQLGGLAGSQFARQFGRLQDVQGRLQVVVAAQIQLKVQRRGLADPLDIFFVQIRMSGPAFRPAGRPAVERFRRASRTATRCGRR